MQYSDELLKACGIAMICLVLILTVGRMSSGIGFAVRMGGAVLIFGIFVLIVKDNIEGLGEIVASHEISGTPYLAKAFSLMMKALGISLISKLCSDICRDCGEGSLANGIDGVGRALILSMCIPLISEILKYSTDIMSRI